jgi:hypothetical protein
VVARGGRSARFYVGLARGFMHTCLHEKGKAKVVDKVGGGLTTWPTGHMARLASHHLVSCRLNQDGNPSLDLYKYRLDWWKLEHTPHFGDLTYKAPIFSVVARHSLVGRVVRV